MRAYLKPGRAGMEEFSLYLIVVLGAASSFIFLVGDGAVFIPVDETRFS